MKLAAVALVVAVAAAAILILYIRSDSSSDDAPAAVLPTPSATAAVAVPTPLPATWRSALGEPPTAPPPRLLSCEDANADGSLNAADGPDFADVDLLLVPDLACIGPGASADFYAANPSDAAGYTCAGGPAPLLIVGIASAGSDMLKPAEGESLGLIPIANEVREGAAAADVSTRLVVAVSAIFGSDPPQTNMERFLASFLQRELSALPCLRAVLIGHSHGGATVTSASAALDATYSDRILGVLIDRTTTLYDRDAQEMPASTQLLNYYQTNEGWHGVALDAPNVQNFDESEERAPIAPSDGAVGSSPAIVSHKTLDDAAPLQGRIADAILTWAAIQNP